MAYKTSYELHHHFPRLAEESGFTFNTHRPRVHIDWNKIKLIDLDSLIRERKFVLIEQHLNDILDCVFESEFDVRILDEGVMKMFRLAQLAVEYQQFCRHYLDRSVYVLREEITSMAQELDASKKQLQEKEEELRKLRKRSRQTFKTPLPYGNDNIAAMILKTLSNKGDIFPSTSNTDAQYNKCKYCDKVFLNQLYLQSHISRRHADVIEVPQREKQLTEPNKENDKMNAEIMELKQKLKDMEQIIVNANNQNITTEKEPERKSTHDENKKTEVDFKDAEVLTNKSEEQLLEKFEQWKKEEHLKHDKEIKLLRTQILETINAIKDKQVQQPEPKDSNVIEKLHSTLVQQGAELLALKQELSNSKIVANVKEDNAANKEAEAQIAFWTKRAEVQSKQYDALLQKLNDVARDAKESRALAESERERAAQLQALLQQSLQRRVCETVQTSTDDLLMLPNKQAFNTPKHEKTNNKSKPVTNRQTLENLHKKAQELLNIDTISSNSSEPSSSSEEKALPPPPRKYKPVENSPKKASAKVPNKIDHSVLVLTKRDAQIDSNAKDKINSIDLQENNSHKFIKTKVKKTKADKMIPVTKHIQEIAVNISGSPIRVVRAKLTEEVNNRLASFGVDPLKSRIPQNVFQKQKMELQQLNEIKAKRIPSYEKVRYSILAYLDANTEEVGKKNHENNDYVSPKKAPKTFRSISSVISNVRSKAMSLVKLNENTKEKLRSINTDVTKKAMTLLKTPSDSGHESPMNSGRSPTKNEIESISNNTKQQRKEKTKYNHENIAEANNGKIISNKKIIKQPKAEVINYDTEDDSNESDHEYHNTKAVVSKTSKSIENLIKSPARRPASADLNSIHTVRKYAIENGDLFMRTQSVTDLSENGNVTQPIGITSKAVLNNENSSDDIESLSDTPRKKAQSDENIQNIKQTKSVLKNASSTSSLNKKKVLFDMDAIQMKSVSASPSQSITEKSDGNEKYELGLVNLDGEEWDISSIENEPLKNDTKIQVNTRASPKIAELKKTIESQLARRNDTPSTAIVGGVDILSGPMARAASAGGSNTSLGSSILDDSEAIPAVNHKAFVKPRKVTEKDDSELDISEFSIDGITVTNKNESF